MLHFRETGRAVVVPIGVRIGLRSELTHWYHDLYLGIGYQAGGGRNVFRRSDYLEARDHLAKLWLNVGYAFGIAW